VLIVHNSGSCCTELTLARCPVLGAWRTSESVERFVVEVSHRQHRCERPVHLQDPLMEVAQRLSGNGVVSLRLELTATPAGQWLPNTAHVRAAAVVVLKLTRTISPGGVTAHHHMEEHSLLKGSGTWNSVSS